MTVYIRPYDEPTRWYGCTLGDHDDIKVGGGACAVYFRDGDPTFHISDPTFYESWAALELAILEVGHTPWMTKEAFARKQDLEREKR